jgi:lipopolysaccharide export system permease protein
MSKTDHRRGRYIKMLPAFVIYLLYLMLLANARSSVEGGAGLAGGIWLVHLGFLLVALTMLFGPKLLLRMQYRGTASA